MTIDAARLLPLVLIAFYLKDCLLLLDSGEAVLMTGVFGRRRLGFGWRHYTLRGREPYLCNPLLPFEPVMRWRWLLAPPGNATVVPPQQIEGLGGLGAAVTAIGAVFLLGLPAALLTHHSITSLLGLLGTGYAWVVFALAVVFFRRQRLGLPTHDFWQLAAEVLLCPPYAVNIVRRLTLRHVVHSDLLALAPELLGAEPTAQAYRECAARVASQLEAEEEGSPRAVRLLEAQRALMARSGAFNV